MKHPGELFEDVDIAPKADPKIEVDPNSKQDPAPKFQGNEKEEVAIKVNQEDNVSEGDKAAATGSESSAYVASASVPSINISSAELTSKMESVKGALGRWSKRVGEATRKAEDLAGNTWQHLKTGPSFADAALGRIAQGTKVLAEGGYEKIFEQTFETVPEEKLQDAFACYLSTSVGPVMGVLYVSTEKLAYCSDNPLSNEDSGTTEWSYYKVMIPLYQLKAVKTSSSSSNSSEKYIQVISVDKHEFWFMGFLNYSVAENLLKELLEVRSLQPA